MEAALFFFGAILGSFLDVVAARYHPDKFLLDPAVIGGRSRCAQCGKKLAWHELIPVISFVIQRGRCRACGGRVSPEHLLAEIISGFVVMLVPGMVRAFSVAAHRSDGIWIALSAIWTAAFLGLLAMSLIDIKWRIVPDEFHVWFAGLGGGLLLYELYGGAAGGGAASQPSLSFLGPYGLLFGAQQPAWLNHVLGAAAGLLFFAGIALITRGAGMGMGDVKLAGSLGFLFGWPDVLFVAAFGFVIGSFYGVFAILAQGKSRTSAVPFGPFLALGALALFFFGGAVADWYFSLLAG